MRYLLILATAILVGCSATGSRYSVRTLPSDKAAIVVYRGPSPPTGRAGTVSVDGRKVGVLKKKNFWREEVNPGSHDVVVDFGKRAGFAAVDPARLNLNLAAGETAYVRYNTAASTYKSLNSDFHSSLARETPEVALVLLEAYREGEPAVTER